MTVAHRLSSKCDKGSIELDYGQWVDSPPRKNSRVYTSGIEYESETHKKKR